MSGGKAVESYEPEEGTEVPDFDEDLAQSYIGRTIIIGITYCDHTGAVTEQRQLHGTISAAGREGIVIALAGTHAGETWTMPPDLESIRSAPAGEYRFRETGEVVVDPDLMATWTVTAPARH
jgi:hypothetical protein